MEKTLTKQLATAKRNKQTQLEKILETLDEVAATIGSYSGTWIPTKDRLMNNLWCNGRLAAFIEKSQTDLGNWVTTINFDRKYTDTTQFISNNTETSGGATQYIQLVFDNNGAVDYSKLENITYDANDRATGHLETTKIVFDDFPLVGQLINSLDVTDTANRIYEYVSGRTKGPADSFTASNSVVKQVEAKTTRTVQTLTSNTTYYTNNTATSNVAGEVDGAIKTQESETHYYTDSTLTTEFQAAETNKLSDTKYFRVEEKHPVSLDERVGPEWRHVYDSTKRFENWGMRAILESATTILAIRGVEYEDRYYGAKVNYSNNTISEYNLRRKIKSRTGSTFKEIELYNFRNINYNSLGQRTSWQVNSNIRGLTISTTYSGVLYDSLGRITNKTVTETIDGIRTISIYSNYVYNSNFQATSYTKVTDGVTYAVTCTYDSFGQLKTTVEVSTVDGVRTTETTEYFYDDYGFVEQIISESLTSTGVFTKHWILNISYGPHWDRLSWDEVIIVDDDYDGNTDYNGALQKILLALTPLSDGSYDYTAIDLTGLTGFDSNITIYTYLWWGITDYPVGTTRGGYAYDSDNYQARFRDYHYIGRKTEIQDDGSQVDTWYDTP